MLARLRTRVQVPPRAGAVDAASFRGTLVASRTLAAEVADGQRPEAVLSFLCRRDRHRLRRTSATLRCFEHSTDGTPATSRTPRSVLCDRTQQCSTVHQCNKRGEARNVVTVWPHGHWGACRLAFRVPRPPGEYVLRMFPPTIIRDTRCLSAKPTVLCRTPFVCACSFGRFYFEQQLLSRGADRNLSSGPSLRHVVVRFRSTFARPFHQFSVLTRRALVLFLAGRINRLLTRLVHVLSHVPLHVLFPHSRDEHHPPLSHHPQGPSP